MLHPLRLVLLSFGIAVVVPVTFTGSFAVGQQAETRSSVKSSIPDSARLMKAWGNDSVQVYLDRRTAWLAPTEKGIADKRFTIPRLCAPIRSVQWTKTKNEPPKFVPEPDHWVFSWKDTRPENRIVKVVFDRKPVMPADSPIAKPAGDRSVMLHAFAARTFGEKLRFEPQWYKNTVGYWTKPGDYATWKLKIAKPGQYSVAMLQGCGQGQGGSDAVITLQASDETVTELPFKTIDTGHFQNFRWNHVGLIDIAKPGEFQLRVQPTRISKGALFDVRTIHLVPQAKAAAEMLSN